MNERWMRSESEGKRWRENLPDAYNRCCGWFFRCRAGSWLYRWPYW